jgi:hypothetical protein
MTVPLYPDLYRSDAKNGIDYQVGARSCIVTDRNGKQIAMVCIERLPLEPPAVEHSHSHEDHSEL